MCSIQQELVQKDVNRELPNRPSAGNGPNDETGGGQTRGLGSGGGREGAGEEVRSALMKHQSALSDHTETIDSD
jgi:hypothetical protein